MATQAATPKWCGAISIIETFQNSSNPSSPAFTVGLGPFHPPSHSQQPSLDDPRRNLVKFILPEEGRSYVVDVAGCAGGIEVMEKVLRKKPLSEAELLAVCHGPPDSIKDKGLTLRRTGRTKRSKALARIFGEDPPVVSPRTSSLTSPARNAFPSQTSRQSTLNDEPDANIPLSEYATTLGDGQRTNKAIKRASTISILSGLGVRDPEKALESPISPTQASAKKLRNSLGQRPPSELIRHI
ncbi:hypothetical protein V8E55_010705 [Tylopilus felleus]